MGRTTWLALSAVVAATLPAPAFAADPTAQAPGSPRGVAVVLVGATSDEAAGRCEGLARAAYAHAELTPSVTEDVARALCGRSEEGESTEAARAARDLRAALAPPFEGVASQALLSALTRQLAVRGVVLAEATPDATRVTLLHRRDGEAGVTLTADPLRFDVGGTEGALADAGVALASLVGAPPCARALGEDGERRSGEGPAPCPSAPPRAEPSADFAWWTWEEPVRGGASLVDSPWFWVAAGGVGALGLTVLVVSQTTDVEVGTIHVDGSVPP